MKPNVFEKEQIKIARRTLRAPKEMVAIMGGMTMTQARDIIRRF